MEQQSPFQFHFQKKRPLWKDLCLFFLSVGFFWGSVHVFLNFDAFAQIANFKADQIKASLIQTQETKAVALDIKQTQVDSIPLIFEHKKLKLQNQAQKLLREMPVYPSDNRLYIPRIKKNVPLITVPNHKNWNQLEKNIQQGLQNGAVVHPISHTPGTPGNFFVTGHSSYYSWDPGRFKDIFALLHEVNRGDMVEVYWNGKKYTYQIKAKEIIPPTETNVLDQPDNMSIITLMTCTPVGTNKNRLVLIGELVKNEETTE